MTKELARRKKKKKNEDVQYKENSQNTEDISIQNNSSGDEEEKGGKVETTTNSGNKSDQVSKKQKDMEVEIVENRVDEVISDNKDKRIKMIRFKNRLKYVEEVDEKNNENNVVSEKGFSSNHTGDIVVVASLNSKFCSKNKVQNSLKIANNLHKFGVKVSKIRSIDFNKVDVYFNNVVEANKCLELEEGKEEKKVIYSIPNRIKRCKGVISDWDLDMPLHELVEAMEDTSRIVSLERMKRRYLDHQSKEMVSRFTHHILVTMEGNELPKMIKIYNGLTAVRIRPFIEPVKQCYNCYRPFKSNMSDRKTLSNLW